ncbi:MAG: iron-sulfur cluster insertion protein ErpA [Sphingomonadales bacterium]|jgi:iron-sulfur cluster insertion protein
MLNTQEKAPLHVTENAVARIKLLREKQGNPDLKLRLGVSGGGCSGFQYTFAFEEAAEAGDTIINENGVEVLVDDMSLMYLLGSELDFVEDLAGAAFQVRNPNAQSSCGCGTSFAV